MNSPTVEIVLEEPGSVFECGAVIKGLVKVTVQEECQDRKLIVAMGYRQNAIAPTQTINNVWKDREIEQLYRGAWTPGTYRYPFSFSAPEGCSYSGAIMTVSWYLRAGVGKHPDASFGIETGDEKIITLGPAAISAADRERNKTSEVVRRESARSSMGCLLKSIVLVLGGSFLAWLGAGHNASLPGLIAALLGLAAVGVIIRQKLIDRKITATELRIGSTVVWPGMRVPCSLTVQAKVPIEIESASIIFEGWEHVKKFTGIYRSTGPVNKHFVHREEKAFELPARTLPAGVPLQLKGDYAVPAKATCSMDIDNEVKFLWRLELRIKIKGSPDWFDIQNITVLARKGNDR